MQTSCNIFSSDQLRCASSGKSEGGQEKINAGKWEKCDRQQICRKKVLRGQDEWRDEICTRKQKPKSRKTGKTVWRQTCRTTNFLSHLAKSKRKLNKDRSWLSGLKNQDSGLRTQASEHSEGRTRCWQLFGQWEEGLHSRLQCDCSLSKLNQTEFALTLRPDATHRRTCTPTPSGSCRNCHFRNSLNSWLETMPGIWRQEARKWHLCAWATATGNLQLASCRLLLATTSLNFRPRPMRMPHSTQVCFNKYLHCLCHLAGSGWIKTFQQLTHSSTVPEQLSVRGTMEPVARKQSAPEAKANAKASITASECKQKWLLLMNFFLRRPRLLQLTQLGFGKLFRGICWRPEIPQKNSEMGRRKLRKLKNI